jgi:hypothetical protein
MSSVIGVQGNIEVNGVSHSFSFPASAYSGVKGFPHSAPPQSISKSSDPAHQSAALNSYVDTDAYTSNLVATATGTKHDLVCLTHSLSAARGESDRIFTEIMAAPKSSTSAPMGGAIGALMSGALEKEGESYEPSVKKRKVA